MGTVERVVFLSLVLDLFGALHVYKFYVQFHDTHLAAAFTIPLPLFPRIIEWYTKVSKPKLPLSPV